MKGGKYTHKKETEKYKNNMANYYLHQWKSYIVSNLPL